MNMNTEKMASEMVGDMTEKEIRELIRELNRRMKNAHIIKELKRAITNGSMEMDQIVEELERLSDKPIYLD